MARTYNYDRLYHPRCEASRAMELRQQSWTFDEIGDTQTPGHVKMLILPACTTGPRSEEFLALKWDVIEFDGPEPKIRVECSVGGKDIREAAKSDNSKAPVPMCGRLGAALFYYKDENPSVNGWVFGSLRTGRPLHLTALGADHLFPAL
ncbi:MAG: hypothetical protein ACLGRW_00980, partial [Acidobacteriota bacterium]